MPWFPMATKWCPQCRKRSCMPGQKRCAKCEADKNITDRKFARIPDLEQIDAELNEIAKLYD